jgi:putative zinc finger/helix-turn-helix YgiT family protein
MVDNIITEPIPRDCPSCGSTDLSEKEIEEAFPFGEEEVIVKAIVPVVTCAACGFSYTDDRAERARHAAICAQEQLLSPDQIKSIRKKLGMSRKEFNEAFGIPPASMERWENGRLLQNRSTDTLLRALMNPATSERLDRRKSIETKQARGNVIQGRFPSLELDPQCLVEARERQGRFLLRVGG